MTCASCSQVIEENGARVPGVESIQVNFATEKAEVLANEKFDEQTFFELLIKLGYRALSLDKVPETKEDGFFNKTFYQSLISLIIGAISMALAMGPISQIFDHSINNIIQLILSTLVLIFFGKTYFLSVIHFIKSGNSNMNTLIGLGLGAAYFYSISLMIISLHSHTYFETIPFIMGFMLLGHFLDEKAKTKARSTMSSLYKMQIKFASKIQDGVEFNTPVIELKMGDVIRLHPGDKIPLDGIVIDGNSHTDESMITGESQAVAKASGEKVFAGSLNLEGTLLLKVESELHQTFISDVVAYVEKAQLKKAPIQKYADKIVHYFVPAIIGISVITLIVWWIFNSTATDRSYQAFSHMISVLLIACPCALGLAVPMAVMLSTVEASKAGLLIGGGEVIERASGINTVVFDKTGTLTEGHPIVSEFITTTKVEEFLAIAGSVTQYSNHPLSHAVTLFVQDKKIKLDDPDKFKNIPGFGVESELNGKKVLVGNAELLKRESIDFPLNEKVGSHVYVAADNTYLGVFIIADPIKAKARETINALSKEGIEVWMLTGDNEPVAKSIAKELGITNIKANVKPIEKADVIFGLKQSGKKVAMIGDGINDAPALTAADLGVAMSSGSDLAIEASEVSILEGKIECVSTFFSLSKRTMRIIKQNLFLSFVYNLLCIPLAAGVFYPIAKISLTPMWASLAMGLSSFSVILSSLRLKKSL